MNAIRILLILAVITVMIGMVLLLTEETTGVGAIGLGCFFVLLARVVQAGEQHDRVMQGFAELLKAMSRDRSRE